MKKNRQNLLLTNLSFALGTSLVGVFLPFLIGKIFELEIWQIFLWGTGVQIIGCIISYPINNFLHRFLSVKKCLQLGLFLHALFYLLISFSKNTPSLLWIASLLYIIGSHIYWPHFHLLNTRATKNAARGNFAGNLQVLFISAGIIAPLITGFLFQVELEKFVGIFAGIFFLFAIYFGQKIQIEDYNLANYRNFGKFFHKIFMKSRACYLISYDGLQGGILWIIWPVFLKSVLGEFSLMGILIGAASFAEMLSAKFFGNFTDKKSASKMLRFSAWTRFLDLGFRGAILMIPKIWMAGFATISAGVLGPIFNISYYTRLMEHSEAIKSHELEFFISREMVLTFGRMLVIGAATIVTFYFDVSCLGYFLMFGALVSFGYRKN
jgi:MFS family permease